MAAQPPPYSPGNEKNGYPEPSAYPQQPGYPIQPQPQTSAYQLPSQAAYPPPQVAYAPPVGQPTTVVVQQPPTVPIIATFNCVPMRTVCPHCRADVVSSIHYENGSLSCLLCAILCILGCNLGCCFIPFCVEGCQDVIHSCPNCRQQIGRWNRM